MNTKFFALIALGFIIALPACHKKNKDMKTNVDIELIDIEDAYVNEEDTAKRVVKF